MSTAQAKFSSWPIVARWTLANLVGWASGLAIGTLLTLGASQLAGVNEDRALLPIALLSAGLTCGVAQWRVLKEYLPDAERWILATLAGYLLALLVSVAIMRPGTRVTEPILFGLMGAAIGLPQWWLLRRTVNRSGLWVFASAIGFLSFLWLVGNPAHSPVEAVVVGAILGAIAGMVPGLVFAWGVRRPSDPARPFA